MGFHVCKSSHHSLGWKAPCGTTRLVIACYNLAHNVNPPWCATVRGIVGGPTTLGMTRTVASSWPGAADGSRRALALDAARVEVVTVMAAPPLPCPGERKPGKHPQSSFVDDSVLLKVGLGYLCLPSGGPGYHSAVGGQFVMSTTRPNISPAPAQAGHSVMTPLVARFVGQLPQKEPERECATLGRPDELTSPY
jgi:hypothetical protein